MRLLIASLIVAGTNFALAEEPPLTLYKTASSAACANDETVWVDPAARLYYLKGDKLYGKTSRGGYSCRKQADGAGYRSSRAK